MRPRTRNLVVGTVLVIALLVAFVAGLGALKSGDPYYVTATAVAEAPDSGVAGGGPDADSENGSAINGTALPTRRFPFTTAALAAAANGSNPGRSGPYWRGPIGLKEVFTHSPFDELDSLRQRNPDAVAGDGVLVRLHNTTYRATVVQEAAAS